jgi:hypothetical protein
MSWIVDGHNLIPNLPGMSLSMPDDEEQLIKLLIEYSRVVRKNLIVYFDNAPSGIARIQRFGYVSAHFVREGSSADAAIRAKLRQLGRGARNWVVVSSDREIQREVKLAGASAISSEEFARSIFITLNDLSNISDVSLEEYPNEAEVKHWLELFTRGKDDAEK